MSKHNCENTISDKHFKLASYAQIKIAETSKSLPSLAVAIQSNTCT